MHHERRLITCGGNRKFASCSDNDENNQTERSYSSAASSWLNVTPFGATSTSQHERVSGTESATSNLAARQSPLSSTRRAATGQQRQCVQVFATSIL